MPVDLRLHLISMVGRTYNLRVASRATRHDVETFTKMLRLNNNSLTALPVRLLAACRTLRTLNISSTKVMNLGPIAVCSTLRKLDFSFSKVKGLSPLEGMDLEELKFVGTEVSDLTYLASGQSLKDLDRSCR